MPPAPRDAATPKARRVRRAPVAAALVGLLSMGGAVAGGYGTGLVLGTRIAPSRDALVAEPRPRPEGPDRPADNGTDPASGGRRTPEVTAPSTPGTVPDPPGGSPSSSPVSTTGASSTPLPPPREEPQPTDPAVPPAPEAPPSDPVAATHRLVGAAAGGDVDQVWELLAPAARTALGGRHVLATRLTDLHDRLAPMRQGSSLSVTTLATARGVVTVVAPLAPAGATALALPFVQVDGHPRLASIDPPPGVRWVAPADERTDLVVAGARRPVRVAVDGAAVEGVPAGSRAVRVTVGALAEGTHQAVAVFVDGDRVTASAFEFALAPPPLEGPDEVPALAPEVEPGG